MFAVLVSRLSVGFMIADRMAQCLPLMEFVTALALVVILVLSLKYGLYMRMVSVIGCAQRGRSNGDWHSSEHRQMIEFNSRRWSNAISTVQKDFMIAILYDKD